MHELLSWRTYRVILRRRKKNVFELKLSVCSEDMGETSARTRLYFIFCMWAKRERIQHRYWYPTPVLLPGKSHGRRSLEGCSPWGRWGSDMTEQLQFHFSVSCIEERNGNPLQCSCLENPRDGGVHNFHFFLANLGKLNFSRNLFISFRWSILLPYSCS